MKGNLDLSSYVQFTTGLVFNNIPDDSQDFPTYVEYKIRQDIDLVRTTRALRRRLVCSCEDYRLYIVYHQAFRRSTDYRRFWGAHIIPTLKTCLGFFYSEISLYCI